MDETVKKPAGGAFGVWRQANFEMIQDKAATMVGGIGRGGVAKKAGELWKQMSEAERAPWEKKFQEQAAAYRAYKESPNGEPSAKKARLRNTGEGEIDSEQSAMITQQRKKDKDEGDNGVKPPAGGAFGEWRTANFKMIQEQAATMAGGIGRGGVAKKASELWKQMSEAERAPWEKKFQEHAAAYKAYKGSPEYKPKIQVRMEKESMDGVEEHEMKDPDTEEETENVETLAKAESMGLAKKLGTLLARPEIVAKGLEAETVLEALTAAGGKVVEAKRALLGA